MFRGRRHPGVDALVRRYMADRGLEALDPRDEHVVRHVDACGVCADRYARLCAAYDDAASATVDAADAAFTADRLLMQRERILRRIDGQSAKVISFPAVDAATRDRSTSRHLVAWVAGAAAAGLFIGLAIGRMLDMGPQTVPGSTSATVVTRPMTAPDGAQARTVSAVQTGDDFLGEVEFALSSPRTPELAALDAMTMNGPRQLSGR